MGDSGATATRVENNSERAVVSTAAAAAVGMRIAKWRLEQLERGY